MAGELAVLEVPGHHIGILSEPRVEIVAKQLSRRIDEAWKKS
jgi:thioesterase domain-containing protein